MKAVGRRSRAGVVVAAAALLTAACAVPSGLRVPDGARYSRIPTSTLVSRRDLQFKLAQVQRGDERTTLLVHEPSPGEAAPVAAISASQSDPLAPVTLRRMSTDANADLHVATLEHLYSLALHQDAAARFCMVEGARPCDAATQGRSHAELLRELARAREHAVARVTHASVPWRVVTMLPVALTGKDEDEVAVRILGDQGPMAGVSVYFNKAPHSSCVGKSGPDGVAACHLVDQHGDEESHAGHDEAAVVATYPGDVRKDRVLVPTTIVVRPGSAG